MYLSIDHIDRKDIRFETKELVRHVQGPREVDWSNLIVWHKICCTNPTLPGSLVSMPKARLPAF